jgi:hypothetical protein
VNFAIKNVIVDGNVILQAGAAAGSGSSAVRSAGRHLLEQQRRRPGSSEVATNTIFGNLVCQGNDPGTQLGDSGGTLNVVGGHASGQCAGLV